MYPAHQEKSSPIFCIVIIIVLFSIRHLLFNNNLLFYYYSFFAHFSYFSSFFLNFFCRFFFFTTLRIYVLQISSRYSMVIVKLEARVFDAWLKLSVCMPALNTLKYISPILLLIYGLYNLVDFQEKTSQNPRLIFLLYSSKIIQGVSNLFKHSSSARGTRCFQNKSIFTFVYLVQKDCNESNV